MILSIRRRVKFSGFVTVMAWMALTSFDQAPVKPLTESKPCLRETNSSHPVPLQARETAEGGYNPDFTSVRIHQKVILRTVNHHLPRKNLSHLGDSVTKNKMSSLSYDEKCTRQWVAKKLHWVWFGTELPEKYASSIEKSAANNPGWEVFLWSEVPSRLLEERLRKMDVNYKFRNITEYLEDGKFRNGDLIRRQEIPAGKSDYLRLEVVYMEGGIYQDTDAISVRGFDDLGDLFRWPFVPYTPGGYHSGGTSNAVFGFEKGSPFLLFAMDLTRENCLAFDRCGVMTGAGPSFLRAALYYYDNADIVLVDDDYLLEKTAKSVTYQTNDATWVEAYLAMNNEQWTMVYMTSESILSVCLVIV